MRGQVWVTVPHAQCPPEDDGTTHLCDYLAPAGALLVREALARAGMPSLLFVGDTPRTVCDLNRAACAAPWARALRAGQPPPAAVVDVHSMPSSASFGVGQGFDVVLLDDSEAPSALTVAVARALAEAGLGVATVRGRGNAIIDDFPASTLVELSEQTLRRDPVRLRRVASAVALGVQRALNLSS